MSKEVFEKGRRIRTEVLGRERVAKALDQADPFNRDFQELLTEYCWGACWGRDGLDRRQRSLLNLGMLAALNRPHEFELHFRAAIGNGLSRAELQDALIQIAIYCGVPAGVEAHRIAGKVLAEPGVVLK
ncbi:MAG: 4-carboxymuconolactone decarboxylase [Alphaproteobacteria bacterium]|nr:4-carboxymuconolactone decarboxylase [Alphaproteobacteria bacterium]MBM3952080.1 4-carboxymuconolactone decarboxylase [Rhodospirillales bacterium]